MLTAHGILESCSVFIVKEYMESVEKLHSCIRCGSVDAMYLCCIFLMTIPVSLITIPVDISRLWTSLKRCLQPLIGWARDYMG